MDVCVRDAVQLQPISKLGLVEQNVQSETTNFSCLFVCFCLFFFFFFFCINVVLMMDFSKFMYCKKYINPRVKVNYYVTPPKQMTVTTSNFAGACVI